MTGFLGIMRRFSLGGVIVLILSIVLRGGVPSGYWGIFLMATPILYLLFSVFSWINVNHTVHRVSSKLDVDLPSQNFISYFFRALILDLFSPILLIIQLFGDLKWRFVVFIFSYIVYAFYVYLWFFILK